MLPVLRRHRVGLASLCVLLAAVGAFVAYAFADPGYAAHHADINDGGIWVTQDSTGRLGRLNKPISQLDGTLNPRRPAAAYSVDVLQNGAAVVGVDTADGQLYPVDVASLSSDPESAVTLPASARAAMAGGTLALLDPGRHTVRAMTFDPDKMIESLQSLTTAPPVVRVGKRAAVTVSDEGTVMAVDADGVLTTVSAGEAGFSAPAQTRRAPMSGALSLTAVGEQPVAMSVVAASQRNDVILPDGRRVTITGADATLQEPGPATDAVVVATRDALYSIDLASGTSTRLMKDGTGLAPAAPVRLGTCTYTAWPGARPLVRTFCDDARPRTQVLQVASNRLAFRVNHAQLLLNSLDDGRVYDLDSRTPRQVANWPTDTAPRNPRDNKRNKQQNEDSRRRPLPPKANPDELGARPGVTTSLYVLDNDRDPSGEVMAVQRVADAGDAASWLSVAPDGQAVVITLPAGTSSDTSFTYFVSGARGGTSSARVTVHARQPGENAPPTRRNGSRDRVWNVPVNGAVSIPILSDWRDYTDGDTVLLDKATVSSGQVLTTADGELLYKAPGVPGKATIDYTVIDGHGGSSSGKVAVAIDGADQHAVAPVAQPDYARGRVGTPIVVHPLDNDQPGSDPLTPTASLRLGGPVKAIAGTRVQSSVADGTVTVTANRPGALTLDYRAGYGTAPTSSSTVRIDVLPSSVSLQPVTSPDSAVVRGQSLVDVDVLANDSDPSGNLLAVQSAIPADKTQVAVGIVDGSFLRVVPLAVRMQPATQTIDYTVTDGVSGLVRGQLTVTQLPAPPADRPVTLADYASVRAGQSVAVPVLDNDVAPAGGPLTLEKPAAGMLTVTPRIGSAYVSGNVVRYVAPASVATPTTVSISYLAQNDAQTADAPGRASISIFPAPTAAHPDQAPTPADLQSRVVLGDTVRIKVPTSNVDPDGDTVTVVGVGSAQRLGRVLGFTASTISYQAFPQLQGGGTDTFTYVVSDTGGERATGTVRVAVVSPGDPQEPLAVPDTVTVAPGASVRVDVLANDLLSPGDPVHVDPLASSNGDLPTSTAQLLSRSGPIRVTAGRKTSTSLAYQLDDGRPITAAGRALVTVRVRPGANLPPVVFDQYAKAVPGARAVRVSLLARAYDPDGSDLPTVVSPESAADGTVAITLTSHPQVVPFVVRDDRGARATAVVYVPAARAGLPFATPGKVVKVPSGGSASVDLRSYVTSPTGRPVRTINSAAQPVAAPSEDLGARLGSDQYHVVLTAQPNTQGPAAVTVPLIDTAAPTTPGTVRAYVTLAVQIGREVPVLRCPPSTIDLIGGGDAATVPLTVLCHIWVPRPDYPIVASASWQRQPAGVSLSADGARVRLQAAASAPDGDGVVLASVSHSNTQPLRVHAYAAPTRNGRPTVPPPSFSPLPLATTNAGKPVSVDVSGGIVSPLGSRARRAVLAGSARVTSGAAAVRSSGAVLTVTPAAGSHGVVVVDFTATDAPGVAARTVRGEARVQVLGPPETPIGLTPGERQDGRVTLSWQPSPDTGLPISYVLKWAGPTSGAITTAQTTATATNLQNGHEYTFTVYAHDDAGESKPSAPKTSTPDRIPGPVTGLTASDPQDRSIALSWNPPTGNFSPAQYYLVTWSGSDGSSSPQPLRVEAPTTTAHPSGLTNDATYTFTVTAVNTIGANAEPSPRVPYQSAGTPMSAGAPTADLVYQSGDAHKKNIEVSWVKWDANGPTPLTYTVQKQTNGAGAWSDLCTDVAASPCDDANVSLDGATYSYRVIGTNGAKHTSDPGPASAPVEASGTPDDFQGQPSLVATGRDTEATLSFDIPFANDNNLTINCTISGGGGCGGFPQSGFSTTGGHFSMAITGFANGQSQSVTLKACNSNKNRSQCSAPATSNSVTAYGPIKNVSVSGVSTHDQNVAWTVNFDPNGKSARIVVKLDNNTVVDQFDATTAGSRQYDRQVGYSHPGSVSIDVSDAGRSSQNDSATYKTEDPPVSPPTISAFDAVPYRGGQHVGVAWNSNYDANSQGKGGQCHWTRDGAEFADALDCAYNGRASRQFYSQPTGSHTYCGYIQMPDGRQSNVLCETVNVT